MQLQCLFTSTETLTARCSFAETLNACSSIFSGLVHLHVARKAALPLNHNLSKEWDLQPRRAIMPKNTLSPYSVLKIIGKLSALTYCSKVAGSLDDLKLNKLDLSDELIFHCSSLHSPLNPVCSAYGEFPAPLIQLKKSLNSPQVRMSPRSPQSTHTQMGRELNTLAEQHWRFKRRGYVSLTLAYL